MVCKGIRRIRLSFFHDKRDAAGPFGSDLVSSDYVEEGVPVIRGQNLSGQWVSGNFAFVTPIKAKSLEANLARPGDIVFTQRGTLGQVSLIPEMPFDSYLVSQSQMKLSVNRTIADPLFFFYVFTSEEQQELIREGTIQTGVPHINLGILRDIPVQLPPLPEQRAIAEALSDADALIESMEQLLAKKRHLKQGAMQELLTGKKRLPGFSGEWEVRVLGDGISLLSGHHVLVQHCNSSGDGIPYLTGPADFPRGTIQHTKFTKKSTTLCARNDILVTVKGSGSGSLIVADGVYCISRQLMAIRVRDWCSQFIYYSLLQNASQIKAASTGLIPGLSRSDILEQPLPIPGVPEQTAIAAVLSDMDAGIAALERKRDKTRALKQGMMQELLTGRIRLI